MGESICFRVGDKVRDVRYRWYYANNPENSVGTVVGVGNDPRRPYIVQWNSSRRGRTHVAPDSIALVGCESPVVVIRSSVERPPVQWIVDHGITFRVGDRVVKFGECGTVKIGRITKIRDDWPSWCGSKAANGGWKRTTVSIRYWVEWDGGWQNSWTGLYKLFVIPEDMTELEAMAIGPRASVLTNRERDRIVEEIRLAYQNPRPEDVMIWTDTYYEDPLERLTRLEEERNTPPEIVEVVEGIYPDDI